MATARGVRLDHRGLGKILKSQAFADVVNDAAIRVAAAAGDNAEVDKYTTDRKAAAVIVPAEDQARDGALTRAAASVGLEVRAKP
ncbi:hypothetical protein [Nocardia sp. CNY236]|uniref:hypothetical protein n=1 Tax=Nocardia sp. CNY236 TaxID=1169152 RepID=UPI00040A747E|nr:hypothetical protein [Nocardia sp. CNY236]